MMSKVDELKRWADYVEKPSDYCAYKPGQAKESLLDAIESALAEEFERGREQGFACRRTPAEGGAQVKGTPGLNFQGDIVDARKYAEHLVSRGILPSRALLERIKSEQKATYEEVRDVLGYEAMEGYWDAANWSKR